MRRTLAILPLAAVLLVGRTASATSAADQAAAEALFNEAKKLVAAGDFEHACPKFAESNRLDPGSGTLLNLGACYEQLGKLASAWGAFNEAAVTARNAGDAGRQEEATRRAATLAPRVSKLTITVSPSARVPGVEVRRDGALVGEGQWGSSIPTDPGQHRIDAAAPGYKPWSTIVQVDANAAATSIDVPPLEKGALPLAPSTPAAVSPAYWNGQRAAGLALGSIGVVGVIVGGALGGLALSKNSASKQDCSPTDPNSCTVAGVALRNTAITAGNGATGAIIAGGALLTTGIVLFATGAPRKTEGARIEVLSGVGALALRGRF
jgi:serine/threonine-protein kinase